MCQTTSYSYSGILSAGKTMHKKGGFKRFYSGLFNTMIKAGPTGAISMLVRDLYLKRI